LVVVIDETMNNDLELGYAFLELIIEKENKVGLVPRTLFRNVLNDESQANRLWELLNNKEFRARNEWKIAYFLGLENNLISAKHAQQLVETIQEGKDPVVISFEPLERYRKFDANLFQKIIEVIYQKNEKEGTRITVWGDLFSKQINHLGNDLKLIKKFYIQQRRIQNHFDFDLKGMKQILVKDSTFLIDYISGLYDEEQHQFIEDHNGFGFVWNFEDAEELITRVFDLVREKALWFGLKEHYCNAFYKNVKTERQDRADSFLINFVKLNYSEPKKINEIVDITLHARKVAFESVLLTYISINQDVEDFSKIQWIGSGGIYSGEVVIGDIRAAKWKNILSIVEKSELGIKLLPIKKRINKFIEGELRSGDWERKRRFLERY
jgi:hypothetical protein